MRAFLIAVLSLIISTAAVAQAAGGAQDREAKVRSATTAAPQSLANKAVIKDWDGTTLRAGTSSWTCYPDMPDTPGNDPMCLDNQWLGWLDAFVNRGTPKTTQMGFGYMLAGSTAESNVAPYETGPTATNQWMTESMPHIMIIVPNENWFAGLPTQPINGGPWVMWRESPLAHIMVPATPHPAVMHNYVSDHSR